MFGDDFVAVCRVI